MLVLNWYWLEKVREEREPYPLFGLFCHFGLVFVLIACLNFGDRDRSLSTASVKLLRWCGERFIIFSRIGKSVKSINAAPWIFSATRRSFNRAGRGRPICRSSLVQMRRLKHSSRTTSSTSQSHGSWGWVREVLGSTANETRLDMLAGGITRGTWVMGIEATSRVLLVSGYGF